MGICLNCFDEVVSNGVCPICGFDKAADKRQSYHLAGGHCLQNRYTVGRVLGFGGFGIIYRGWDSALDIPVAIKEYFPVGIVGRSENGVDVTLLSEESSGVFDTGMTRFKEEARHIALFGGMSSVVKVFGCFIENGTSYIVMEYLQQSLSEYTEEQGGRLSYNETKRLMRPVAAALSALHSKKIIHRDLSLDNIMLSESGEVKLIDFGEARLSQDDVPATRSVVVKIGYTPPEQYSDRGKQGYFTDMYAFGAVIYRLLTGVLPDESIDRAVKDRLVSPKKLGADIPANADKAVMRALALKPGLRYKSVAEFSRAFFDDKNTEYPEAELKRRRRLRIAGAVFAAAGIAVAGIMYTAFNRVYTLTPDTVAGGEIEVWVAADKTSGDSHELTWLAESFCDIDGYGKYSITVKEVDATDYEQSLLLAAQGGSAPDLFDSELLSPSARQELCESPGIYYRMNNDNLFLGSEMSKLSRDRVIPTGFKLPVAYINCALLAKNGVFPAEKYAQLSELPVGLKAGGELEAPVVFGEDAAAAALKSLSAAETDDGVYIAAPDKAKELFLNGKAGVYVGFSSELADVQSVAALAGCIQVAGVGDSRICGEFTGFLGISKASSNKEQRIAMLFLKYLSGINYKDGLGISQKSLSAYITENKELFGFIGDISVIEVEYGESLPQEGGQIQ